MISTCRGLLLIIDPRPTLCTRGFMGRLFIIHRLGKGFIRKRAIAAENAETPVPSRLCRHALGAYTSLRDDNPTAPLQSGEVSGPLYEWRWRCRANRAACAYATSSS